jgi:hypothetical protein
MPKVPSQKASKQTQSEEEKITLASQELERIAKRLPDGKQPKILPAAQRWGIPYHLLYRRYNQICKARGQAHPKRLLSIPQEDVVVQWFIFLGLMGVAQTKDMALAKVYAVSGKVPGRNWYSRFMKRHQTRLVSGRGSNLDPKRAQAFNFATVDRYFNRLKERLEDLKVPWEHVWNMDEKGIQLGGGRKHNTRYIFSRGQREKYRMMSDDLELVTVVECVSATGQAMRPGLIFAGSGQCEEWYEPDIGRVL